MASGGGANSGQDAAASAGLDIACKVGAAATSASPVTADVAIAVTKANFTNTVHLLAAHNLWAVMQLCTDNIYGAGASARALYATRSGLPSATAAVATAAANPAAATAAAGPSQAAGGGVAAATPSQVMQSVDASCQTDSCMGADPGSGPASTSQHAAAMQEQPAPSASTHTTGVSSPVLHAMPAQHAGVSAAGMQAAEHTAVPVAPGAAASLHFGVRRASSKQGGLGVMLRQVRSKIKGSVGKVLHSSA